MSEEKTTKDEGREGERPPALSDRLRVALKGETRKGRELRHGAIMELLEEQDGWRQAAEKMLFRAQKLADEEARFLTNTKRDSGGVADRLRQLAADIWTLLGVEKP